MNMICSRSKAVVVVRMVVSAVRLDNACPTLAVLVRGRTPARLRKVHSQSRTFEDAKSIHMHRTSRQWLESNENLQFLHL
jgi:hypothetical protein